MSRMAYAAMLGGAAGIRANTVEDITAIKETVDLPVIGIIKRVYGDCPVFITPTEREVDALVACGTEVIALDATSRPRPDEMCIRDRGWTRPALPCPALIGQPKIPRAVRSWRWEPASLRG